MRDNKIGIVTVLYNSESVLEDFFRTLNEQTYKNFVLYLVDNNSTDLSVQQGKKYAKKVDFMCKWLLQEKNLGVAEGNNIGIKAALADGCDYILLANNDIVLQTQTIDLLMNGMQAMNAAMAVPKIYYWNTDNVIWCAGGDFLWLQCSVIHYGDNEKDSDLYNQRKVVRYSPTCFMLIKSSVFSQVGFMDSSYFVYYDDTDFIWRATKKQGNKLVYIPESILWHKVSSCTGGKESDFTIKYVNRNQIYFALKNASKLQLCCFGVYLLIHYLLKKMRRYNVQQRKLILKSYLEGWKLFYQQI